MIHVTKTALSWSMQIILLLCLCAPGWAQQSEMDALDEIVVTATRRESSLRDVPRSVSVVNKERIQNATQQLGLDEALAGVPGLYIQNRYNFAGDLRVSLRGFGARSSFGIRGIRIFVDGIPETLPDGQAGVDSIDMGSAQSIEVLRGPASSLYGNASGGVIAVTSELGTTDPYVEGKVAGGEFGFQQYGLKAAGKGSRKFSWHAGQRQGGHTVQRERSTPGCAESHRPAIGAGPRWHQCRPGCNGSVLGKRSQPVI